MRYILVFEMTIYIKRLLERSNMPNSLLNGYNKLRSRQVITKRELHVKISSIILIGFMK